jgi:hypothetical protein
MVEVPNGCFPYLAGRRQFLTPPSANEGRKSAFPPKADIIGGCVKLLLLTQSGHSLTETSLFLERHQGPGGSGHRAYGLGGGVMKKSGVFGAAS